MCTTLHNPVTLAVSSSTSSWNEYDNSFVSAFFPQRKAPKTCEAFCSRLPFKSKFVHVRWSGEAVWAPLGDYQLGVEYENHTCHPSRGDILFYIGGISETEIIFAYGSCSFASKVGALAGNHFLTIVEGRENMESLGKECLWKGAQDVVFEAYD